MNTPAVVVLLALIPAMSAFAQGSASEVTDEQVSIYRTGLEMGCRDAGRRRGDPEAQVNGFCTCMMDVLSKSMTHSEWQQAFFYSVRKRDREEMTVLQTHMPKVKACRNGS